MTISFGRLWELMEQDIGGQDDTANDPAPDNGDPDTGAMNAIRTGINIRAKKDCGDFWDDFIKVCGNADAMSELLDVPREKVTGWAGRIQELLDKVGKSDEESASSRKKSAEMLSTGDPEIADFGKDGTVSHGQEMNPMPS